MFERGQQRDPGVHTDDGISGPLRVARRPVRVAGRRRHARGLLDVQRPADVVAPRAPQAEPWHPDNDQVGLQRHQRLVVQTEVLDNSRREVLDDHVGLRGQPAGDLEAPLRGQIECEVPLVEVGGLPDRAALVPVVALEGKGSRVTETVGPLDGFDFDDVGAKRTEVTRRIRAGPKSGQVQHPQSRKGKRVVGGPKRFAASGPRRRPRAQPGCWMSICHRGFREPKRRPGALERPGVFPVTPTLDEESAGGVLRGVQRGAAVVDGRGRDAHRLAQFDDLGDGSLGEYWLGFGEELGALGTAHHDGDLVLAEFRQAEHRAHVQPVLARQAVDSHPAVGRSDDTQHWAAPLVGGYPETFHAFGHQHRIRQCRDQRLKLRDIDLPYVPAAR